ncbi:MAG TPA: MmcQ/YjbR family DNA-binding protein [Actinomycetota bacterium]|nr:MmcQ/YjbR family DNA-binding protein [Actinomycetota bacterium]
MVTIDDVRAVAKGLPRSYEVLVRDRVKFRVGCLVYLAFARAESMMGFAFPKEERESLIAAEPHKFLMPKKSDLRYNWVVVRLSEIGRDELEVIVLEAWRVVVPKFLAAEVLGPRRSG